MLGAAEGGAADTAFGIDNSFIEALVGKHRLTSHRFIEMAQSLVQEAAIYDANVVAEVARRTGDQVGRRCRRVAEAVVLFRDQPDGLERRQKRPCTIGRNSSGLGDRGKRVDPTCDLREQVELDRREQGFRGDEPVSDG